ncbi:MAG: hypothetical protein ABEH64_09775 [Salinirussus sp.]
MESPEEFEAAISEIIQVAQQRGIDPRGTYISRGDDGLADYEIEVIELED